MIETFTKNDLIRYLYHETTEEEARKIRSALAADQKLAAVFEELCQLKDQLDGAMLEPSASTIANILHYARGVVEKE